MEADEICVILARASELHVKISEAIERALKSEFLHTTSSQSIDSNFSSSGEEDINGFDSSGDSNLEARTLGLIRNALETLEEQLEALQSMQNHQRAEKDAVLLELEESRHRLLLKLRNHRGREWGVVQEALAFAGEHVEETGDLLLPPYPRPDVNDENQSPNHLVRAISLPRGRAAKRLSLSEDDISSQGPLIGKQDHQEQEHEVVALRGIMRGLGGRVGHALVHAAKAVLVVASVVVFLAFTEHNHRQVEPTPRPIPRPIPSAVKQSRPRPPSPLKCTPGQKLLVLEDGTAKCVVKERFELPFPREVKDPDVLYGRG